MGFPNVSGGLHTMKESRSHKASYRFHTGLAQVFSLELHTIRIHAQESENKSVVFFVWNFLSH